jgi:5'-3' exonuclease
MESYPFLGRFVHDEIMYFVKEEDYADIPDEQYEKVSDLELVKLIKIVAMQKGNLVDPEQREPRGATMNHLRPEFPTRDEDVVPRYIGNIVLFDANNLAHRARHVHDLSYQGADVSVIYGVLTSLKVALKKYEAAVAVMCWDDGIPAFRQERMKSYKADRAAKRDDEVDWVDFGRQLDEIKKVLGRLGVLSVSVPNNEADDLIAHAVTAFNEDYRRIIITSDKDLWQCVTYGVEVFSPFYKDTLTTDNFEKWTDGISKKDYLTYRCLVGDSSDGLIGCRGIGKETAKKLIADYGDSPSGMINAATGQGPEVTPMADGVKSKLRTFGLKGFMDMMTVMRLDKDMSGAGVGVLSAMEHWHPFDKTWIKRYLNDHGFLSLMDTDFYDQFRRLRDPKSVLSANLGYRVRFPRLEVTRDPPVIPAE